MQPRDSAYIIGVDTGGTFTDIAVLSARGEITRAKAPTTPWDFSIGVMDSIAEAATALGVERLQLLARTRTIMHGSTVATNALITRRGVPTGFLTTRGFEDTTLIMRAVGRVDGLPQEEVRQVARVTKPEPLVPKDRIRGVSERVDYKGQTLVPLNRERSLEVMRDLIEGQGVKAVAVSLLHSWSNPVHEQAIKQLAQGHYPNVYWSFGSDLAQVAGEYARANTAIINAYVGPVVGRYLEGLAQRLGEEGFAGNLLVMQGNGGVAGVEQVTPVANFQSGPAAGLISGAYMAGLLGHPKVITTDMGGTSFDVGVLVDGVWRYAEEPIVERFRITQPIIDVESIGAGGGTIARVEVETGRLLVGPDSAAASPGPAAYDQGGEQPTVTDADLVLGILDPRYFLGGRKVLNKAKAEQAIRDKIARPLGLELVEAAAGIYDIINSKMADLIRKKVVATGYLPEEFVLYAFGGAGPTHVAGFAGELGIKKVYVSPNAAVFCALGAALSDVVHSAIATYNVRLPVTPQTLNQKLDEIEGSLRATMTREGFPEEAVSFRRFLTMRYRRQTQGVEIQVPWDRFAPDNVGLLSGLFEGKYEELYGVGTGYAAAGIEIAALRVDAVGKVPKPAMPQERPAGPDPSAAWKGQRDVFFTRPGRGSRVTPVYEYGKLSVSNVVRGPAIIESPITTVLVTQGWRATVDEYRNLVMEAAS